MKYSLKIQQFCSLSTSAVFQAWLYKFNSDLYSAFIARLHKSGGCSENSDIMRSLLGDIVRFGGSDDLYSFLSKQFPFIIDKVEVVGDGVVFKDFVAGVLTYPHRIIVNGDNLQSTIKDIITDKSKYDFVIVGDVAYVEFLNADESHLIDKVPRGNWQTTAYKESLNGSSKT